MKTIYTYILIFCTFLCANSQEHDFFITLLNTIEDTETEALRIPITYMHNETLDATKFYHHRHFPMLKGCGGFNKKSFTLTGATDCGTNLWLANLPVDLTGQNLTNAFRFEMTFSVEQESFKAKEGWPIMVMLGNSPKGYTYLMIDNNGHPVVGYRDNDGFHDTVSFDGDHKLDFTRSNTVVFTWLNNGYHRLQLNDYAVIMPKDSEKEDLIPVYGLSNRISTKDILHIEEVKLESIPIYTEEYDNAYLLNWQTIDTEINNYLKEKQPSGFDNGFEYRFVTHHKHPYEDTKRILYAQIRGYEYSMLGNEIVQYEAIKIILDANGDVVSISQDL
ncbi:hypothetical protein Q2T40_18390 [Winogradskyella maritima]|uniref:Uncharacterized protein n=1 Tax=Winogradskyella maritima TaxID=1517766 RepID=A0ABV8AI31_9FLAO|nr:hypothetical protein [Winogradskyella maritima]